jgi:hypothetical protein
MYRRVPSLPSVCGILGTSQRVIALLQIEACPLYAAVATKVVEYAGLADRVKIVIGASTTTIPTLTER